MIQNEKKWLAVAVSTSIFSVKSTENYDPDNLAVATAEEESVNRNTGKNESPNSSGCNRYDNENKTTDYSMVFLLIAPLLIWSRRKGADD